MNILLYLYALANSKNFSTGLLRNKIAEIIAKIARKIEKLHGVLDNQKFYSNLMFFKVVVFMKKRTKNNLFLNN